MPTGSLSDRDRTLGALLAARARAASDGRLVLDAAGGVVAVVAAALWRPPAWGLLLAAAGCFLSYGAWGIADRTLEGRDRASREARLLRIVKGAAVALGALSGGALLVGGLLVGLGPLIS